MNTLNYDVLEKSGYQGYILENAPEKVMQFGEGNFLRAFVNYWFEWQVRADSAYCTRSDRSD